jgi:hypothetical protein
MREVISFRKRVTGTGGLDIGRGDIVLGRVWS